MCELGDYFSRLGGAARPFNMAESEIQLYIGYKLLSINDDPIHVTEFENQEFLKAAEPVIKKTNAYLAEVQLAGSELISFVLEFYEYANGKLKENDKTTRWARFGDYLRANNA